MHLARHAAIKGPPGQGAQQRLLTLPHLSNALRLPIDHAHLIAPTLLLEEAIQFLKAGHVRQRHEKIASTEADAALHASLLMPLGRRRVNAIRTASDCERRQRRAALRECVLQ